jgi:bifunctional non-homologous end joining protein LigD
VRWGNFGLGPALRGLHAQRTRGGHDCTSWFPKVGEPLARFKGGPYVVDGEVCAMDEIGRSDFPRLQGRAVRRCY